MATKKPVKINLGCCDNYQAGYINIDRSKEFKADQYFDFEEAWPIKSATVNEIMAFHIVEHIMDLRHFMREAHRVLVKGGLMHIKTPWWSGHWAVGDPSHVRLINDMTFNAWSCWFDRYPHINDGCRFEQIKEQFNLDPGWGKDPFLNKGGFSAIEEYELFLEKV